MDGVEEEVKEGFNPYTSENATALILVTLLRIYDVNLAQLRAVDKSAYQALMQEHSRGNLVAFPPGFVETFIASDINGSS